MRRWAAIGTHTSRHIERAVASSSPPSFKHCTPPLADPGGQSSACSAAVAGNSSTPLHSASQQSAPTQPLTPETSQKTPTVLPKQLKKYKKTTQTGVSGTPPRGSVTVPGRLRRVVYTAPQASAGYRGCIPWWRRSHHPGSPSTHPGRRKRSSRYLLLSELTPSVRSVSFFFSPPLTWADRIDFPPACGCISLRSASSLPHTLPPLPPPRLTCSLPSPVLSLSELTEGWVPEPGYIHPLMFIKQALIDYS